LKLEQDAARRVGMFGGAFDPPHSGHVAIARTALQQLGLDVLHVVPTGQAWHKARNLSPSADRLAMARLAFDGCERVVIDPRETLRSGPTYTVDTLRAMQLEYPSAQLFLVMGEDQAQALPAWHQCNEVAEIAIICVADRTGNTRDCTALGTELPTQSAVKRLNMPAMDVSSTELRSRFAAGQGVHALVSNSVARYIAHHHLYQSP
jgi:nicotinate-nucleotide adenylyltransferase